MQQQIGLLMLHHNRPILSPFCIHLSLLIANEVWELPIETVKATPLCIHILFPLIPIICIQCCTISFLPINHICRLISSCRNFMSGPFPYTNLFSFMIFTPAGYCNTPYAARSANLFLHHLLALSFLILHKC